MTRVTSSVRSFLLIAFSTVLAVSTVQAGRLIAYPSPDDAVFTVSAPDNWELVPGENEGDFFNLNGPTGALVSFRAVPGSHANMNDAIDETIDFVTGSYNGVTFGEAVESTLDGQPAVLMTGSGRDKRDGAPVSFAMAWSVMKNGNIAEIWFAAAPNDNAGRAQAGAIINSFKAR